MRSPLPTISEIMRAIRSASERPNMLKSDELHWLTTVLHASYDEHRKEHFDALADEYASATEDGNNLQQDVVIALSCLPNGAADWIVSDVIRYFDADDQFYELAHALLALAFPVSQTEVDKSLPGSDMQRAVLSAVIRNEAIWRSDMTFADRLSERGLPIHRDEVARLMAGTENVQ